MEAVDQDENSQELDEIVNQRNDTSNASNANEFDEGDSLPNVDTRNDLSNLIVENNLEDANWLENFQEMDDVNWAAFLQVANKFIEDEPLADNYLDEMDWNEIDH